MSFLTACVRRSPPLVGVLLMARKAVPILSRSGLRKGWFPFILLFVFHNGLAQEHSYYDDGRLTDSTRIESVNGKVRFIFSPHVENAFGNSPHGQSLKRALGELLIYRKFLIELLLQELDVAKLLSEIHGEKIPLEELFPPELRQALGSSFNRANFPDFQRLVEPLQTTSNLPPMSPEAEKEFFLALFEQSLSVLRNERMIELTMKDDVRVARSSTIPVEEEESPPPQYPERIVQEKKALRFAQNDTLRRLLSVATDQATEGNRVLLHPLEDPYPLIQFKHREIFQTLGDINRKLRHPEHPTTLAMTLVAIALDKISEIKTAEGQLFDPAWLERDSKENPFDRINWDRLPRDKIMELSLQDMKQAYRLALRQSIQTKISYLLELCELSPRSIVENLTDGKSKTWAGIEEEPLDPEKMLYKFIDLAPFFNNTKIQEKIRKIFQLENLEQTDLVKTLSEISAKKQADIERRNDRIWYFNIGAALIGIGAGMGAATTEMAATTGFIRGRKFLWAVAVCDAIVTATNVIPLRGEIRAYTRLLDSLYFLVKQKEPFNVNSQSYQHQIFIERESYENYVFSMITVGLNGAVALSAPALFRMVRGLRASPDAAYVALGTTNVADQHHQAVEVMEYIEREFPKAWARIRNHPDWITAQRFPNPGVRVRQGPDIGQIITSQAAGEAPAFLAAETRSALRQYELQVSEMGRQFERDMGIKLNQLREAKDEDQKALLIAQYNELDKQRKHLRNLKHTFSDANDALKQEYKYDHHDSPGVRRVTRVLVGTKELTGKAAELVDDGAARVAATLRARMPGTVDAIAAIYRGSRTILARTATVPWDVIMKTPAGARLDAFLRTYFKEAFAPFEDPRLLDTKLAEELDLPPPDWKLPPKPDADFATRAGHATRRTLQGETLWTKGEGKLPQPLFNAMKRVHGEKFANWLENKNWDEDFYDWLMRKTKGKREIDRATVTKFWNQGVVIGLPVTAVTDRAFNGGHNAKSILPWNFDTEGFWEGVKHGNWDKTIINLFVGVPQIGYQTVINVASMSFGRKMAMTIPASYTLQGVVSLFVNGVDLKWQPTELNFVDFNPRVLSPDCWREVVMRQNIGSVYNATLSQGKAWFFWLLRDAVENAFGKGPKTASAVFLISIVDKAAGNVMWNYFLTTPHNPAHWFNTNSPTRLPLYAQGQCGELPDYFGSLMLGDPSLAAQWAKSAASSIGIQWPPVILDDSPLLARISKEEEDEPLPIMIGPRRKH